MIKKTSSLQVVGRRNKQQILKEFLRPAPSVVVSGPEITIGEGGGQGRGCAGTGDPTPSGGSVSGTLCEGYGEDVPLWDWDDYPSSDFDSSTNEPDDGTLAGTIFTWPDIPFVDDSQFGLRQQGEISVFTSCSEALVGAIRGTISFNGSMVSELPVYAPTTHLGSPLEPGHFVGAPGSGSILPLGDPDAPSYSANGIDTNQNCSVQPSSSYTSRQWEYYQSSGYGYQTGKLMYFSDVSTGSYPAKVGAISNEWVWVETSNISTHPFQQQAFRTGMTSPNSISFFLFKNRDTGENYLQLGSLRVYPIGDGMSPFGSWGWVFDRDGGTTDNAFLQTDNRARTTIGGVDGHLSIVWYAYAEEENPPAGPVEMTLFRDGDGRYVSPVDVEAFQSVTFDGIDVEEGTHYTVDLEINAIIPTEALDEDAIVIAVIERA